RVLRGEASGERVPVRGGQPVRRRRQTTGLGGRERLLERGASRVGGTRVLVAAAQAADAVLLVRRDLVDGRHDGAGRRVRVLPRVDRARGEAGGGPVGVLARRGHPTTLRRAPRVEHVVLARPAAWTGRDRM